MNEAARLIQKFWRRYRLKAAFLYIIERRNKCASKLQKQWRVHRRNNMIDRIQNYKQNKSSIKIQSMLRGLLVAKKYEHVYVKMRLTDNLHNFEKMKGNL
jgi:hypothetical protein